MQRRKTVRSLPLYLILSGLAGLFVSGWALRVSLQSSAAIEVALRAISIAFSLTFLYVGFCLAGLLRTSSGRIVTLLYASAGWSVVQIFTQFSADRHTVRIGHSTLGTALRLVFC
jgi:hypothetical protein